MKLRQLLLFVIVCACAAAVAGQVTEPVIEKQPSPKFPKGSDMTGVVGNIVINATVDEKGIVTSAEFKEGPGWTCPVVTNPLINEAREAAKAAALKARFIPVRENGKPVSGTSMLTYPFGVPPKVEKNAKGMRLTLIGSSDEPPPPGSPPSRGVLNGKAIALPKPKYPRAAIAVKAGGAVQILVLIDGDGTILSAEPVSGHPLLRSSARTAACGAKFSQTLLEGEPVKVSGLITYNFIP